MSGLNTASIIPLYQQLKDIIMNDIEDGNLKPGEQIMTEKEFSEKYQVSRITIRKALAELVEEGILAKRQGKGTFVQQKKITEFLNEAGSFTDLCARNDKKAGSRVLKLQLEPATELDVEELKVEKGEKVIHIERLRMANESPIMVENLYFPYKYNGILNEDLENSSLYRILEEKYHVKSGDSRMEFEITMSSSSVAQLLQVNSGAPLFLVKELVLDKEGNPLHRTKSYLRGDQVRYVNRKFK